MTAPTFANAAVLLLDPVSANLAASRQALTARRFGRVDAVLSFEQFLDLARTGDHDLIVVETHGRHEEVVEFARRIRTGDEGSNPFVVMILTMWSREAGHVRSALDCGADDVLLRPFSAATLASRIETLVSARKGFVVTSEYVGPDRRKDKERGGDIALVEVPNTLKAAATDDPEEIARVRRAIAETSATVELERLRRLAIRVTTSARLGLREDAGPETVGLQEMDRAARELRQRARAQGGDDASRLAATLSEITATAVENGEASREQLELIRDLSMGVFAAVAGDSAAASSGAEVDKLVARLQERMRRGPSASAA